MTTMLRGQAEIEGVLNAKGFGPYLFQMVGAYDQFLATEIQISAASTAQLVGGVSPSIAAITEINFLLLNPDQAIRVGLHGVTASSVPPRARRQRAGHRCRERDYRSHQSPRHRNPRIYNRGTGTQRDGGGPRGRNERRRRDTQDAQRRGDTDCRDDQREQRKNSHGADTEHIGGAMRGHGLSQQGEEFWADEKWPQALVPRGDRFCRFLCWWRGHAWATHYWSGMGEEGWPQHEYCECCWRFRKKEAFHGQ